MCSVFSCLLGHVRILWYRSACWITAVSSPSYSRINSLKRSIKGQRISRVFLWFSLLHTQSSVLFLCSLPVSRQLVRMWLLHFLPRVTFILTVLSWTKSLKSQKTLKTIVPRWHYSNKLKKHGILTSISQHTPCPISQLPRVTLLKSSSFITVTPQLNMSKLLHLDYFWSFSKCVFAQTPEWLDSDSCQKCEQPFFWNFKQMWDSKKIGLRQVLYNCIHNVVLFVWRSCRMENCIHPGIVE